MELTTLLEQFGFSEKEAKVYLACLELGQAPVSSIARNVGEQRVTTYAIIKKLIARGVAQSVVKGNATFYSVIEAEQLLQTWETKFQTFKDKIPEFLAISGKFDNKPKVQFYEGLEALKSLYKQIVITEEDEMGKSDSYLIFVWATDIDPRFQDFLLQDFISWRSKYSLSSKVIIPKQALNQVYVQSNAKRHEHLIIDNPVFDLSGEIIVYGKNKVAIMMYGVGELSALVVTSKMLHQGFKGMFTLIWEAYKK